MSKEYETTIFIPISYNNFPESQQLISNLETQMELKVKSHGFYLLSNNLFKSKTLQISVNNLEESKTRKYSQKQWVVNKNLKKIYKLLSADIKILSTIPDTLFVRFQQKHSKKVAVVFNGDINFSVQYRMNDKIQLTPDSIFVFGTKENLSEINFVESDNVIFVEVEKPIKQDINLSEIDGISFSEKKVQISFKVEKIDIFRVHQIFLFLLPSGISHIYICYKSTNISSFGFKYFKTLNRNSVHGSVFFIFFR